MRLPRPEVHAQVPTVPLADLAFVALTLLFVTTVFSTVRGVDFDLTPRATGEPLDAEHAVFVKIEADGSFSVDCQPMALSALLDSLAPALAADPGKPVILYVDPDARYRDLIAVYDVLRGATERVAVPTRSEIRRSIDRFGHNPFESRCP